MSADVRGAYVKSVAPRKRGRHGPLMSARQVHSRPRAPRGRWHVAMVGGAAAHHGFELGAGAGLMLQRELGLGGAVATWATAFPALGVLAWRRPVPGQAVLAFVAGANLAAVVVHFTLWPSRFRYGVPVLTSAEGLAGGHLPAYNAILLSWGAASAGAVLREIPGRSRRWALAGFLFALPLRRDARRHFCWIQKQARVNPAWWNRALQRSSRAPV